LTAIALKSAQETRGNEWWIDSGASQHMTYEKKSLLNFQKFEQPLSVMLADDSCLYSYGKGDVKLTVRDGDGSIDLTLNDVLFVPKIQNKLFSLPSVTDKGASVSFDKHSCEISIDGKSYRIGHKQNLKVHLIYGICDTDT